MKTIFKYAFGFFINSFYFYTNKFITRQTSNRLSYPIFADWVIWLELLVFSDHLDTFAISIQRQYHQSR